MSKKIFITGGAQRIGKELVKHFHSIGWDIIFQYRSSKVDAEELTARLNLKDQNPVLPCSAILIIKNLVKISMKNFLFKQKIFMH